MPKKKTPQFMQIPEGPTTKEIIQQIPRLTPGSFNHWVKYRAGIQPIGSKPAGRSGLTDVFPLDTVERVLRVMGEEKL
jgi:hypothetical protein